MASVDEEGCPLTGTHRCVLYFAKGQTSPVETFWSFSASSVKYGGRLPKDVESFLAGACPIVRSYGAKDRWNRGLAAQLERVLTATGVAHDVKEYPDAGHSFLNDHHNVLFKMMKVIGIGYHEPSAQNARRRSVSFFNTHLK
jgi:carboxymethylenebutenolidase